MNTVPKSEITAAGTAPRTVMVLGKTLVDATGAAHEMAGLLSHSTNFARRKMVLGYRRARD